MVSVALCHLKLYVREIDEDVVPLNQLSGRDLSDSLYYKFQSKKKYSMENITNKINVLDDHIN